VNACLGRTEAQARPWAVYTCGPMGVGKGHVMLAIIVLLMI
jgi:DNA replication protein DnaC